VAVPLSHRQRGGDIRAVRKRYPATTTETVRIEAGDYVAFPADESGAHRVVNEGDDSVRYLAMSTMTEPDVTVYPDSETFGVFVGSPPGGREERSLSGYYQIDDTVDYWEL